MSKNNKDIENKYYVSLDENKLRTDETMIKIVEELDKKANGHFAELKVVEIPDNVDWEIRDYDGMENIEEKHRSWG